MFGLILGVLVAVSCAVIVIYISRFSKHEYREDQYGNYVYDESHNRIKDKVFPYRKYSLPVAGAGILLSVILVLLGCLAPVKTGHTGVVTVFGKVEDRTLDAGFHIKAPWEKVVQMDNRVQKSVIELACFSSDIQEVSCVYTLNHQISKANAQELYRSVGTGYYDTAITPTVAESVKTITAHYTAEELISNRDNLASEIERLLVTELSRYNIEVVSTAIEDLDFTDSFTGAVEAKQVAAQNKLKAEIEQAQSIKQAEADAEVARTKAEADANVAVIKAEADAEVAKVKADADAYAGFKEAEKNKAITESLDYNLLDYYKIKQWDGEYPETYVGSGDASIIVN